MSSRERIVQIIPARPGFRLVLSSEDGTPWAEAVEAWGLAVCDDGVNRVVPLVADPTVSRLVRLDATRWCLGLLPPESASVDLAGFSEEARQVADEWQRECEKREAASSAQPKADDGPF